MAAPPWAAMPGMSARHILHAAHQVDFETAGPAFVRKVFEGPCFPNTQVVDQNVGSPLKPAEDVRNGMIGTHGGSEVGDHDSGPAAGFFLKSRFVLIANDDARALLRQEVGYCFSDTVGSGVDIRKFSLQLIIHFPLAFGRANA